jgi:hypothetical protein
MYGNRRWRSILNGAAGATAEARALLTTISRYSSSK